MLCYHERKPLKQIREVVLLVALRTDQRRTRPSGVPGLVQAAGFELRLGHFRSGFRPTHPSSLPDWYEASRDGVCSRR